MSVAKIHDPKRACWWCEHFELTNETSGYSELTPGSDFAITCLKGRWYFNAEHDDAARFGVAMDTAQTCTDFVRKP